MQANFTPLPKIIDGERKTRIFNKLFKPDIKELKNKRDVEGLAEALKHEDVSIQCSAVDALGEIGGARAVELLIEALDISKHCLARAHAVQALEKIGDVRAVDTLIQALKDDDHHIQILAVRALIKIRDERTVEPLIQHLRGEQDHVRWEAAHAFGEMGKKKDEFDLVYREVARHLDLPEERMPEEELHYTGRDIEEVIAKLCTIAIPQTPIITEAQVESKYRDLSKSWSWGITLKRGTLTELSNAIRSRLKRDSEDSEFEDFQLITYYYQKCSQVESCFRRTFRGYRVWRTEKDLFFSFSHE